jgi:hypothetical protein
MDRDEAKREAFGLFESLGRAAAAGWSRSDPAERAAAWEAMDDGYRRLGELEHAFDGVAHEAGFEVWAPEVWGGFARLYGVLAAASRCGADGSERMVSRWPALEDGGTATHGLNWLARNEIGGQALVDLVLTLRSRVPGLVADSH